MGWIRKTRICLISSVAVMLIVLAVAFTVLRAMLPYATTYIAEIESGIRAQIGLPVSIGSLDADMHWFTPRLKVLDLVIYKEDGKEVLISLTEANFSLAYIDSIRFMMPMVGHVSLHGAELFIERHPNDKWVVQGYEIYERESSKDSEELIEIVLSADISLIDSRIHWRDYTGRSRNMDFEGASVLFENYLGTQYIEFDVGLPADLGERFRLVAELNGDLRDFASLEADLYASGSGLIFSNWVNTTRIKEFIGGSGKLDAEIWLHIDKADITRFSGHFNATDLMLSNIKERNKTWQAARLDTSIFWRALNEGWRLDIRDLQVETGAAPWNATSDIIVAKDEADWRVLASYFKPFDMVSLIDILPETVDLSAVSKYVDYVPSGEVFNFEAIFTEDENPHLELNAAFSDLDLSLVDSDVAFTGLDGEVQIDGNTSVLMIDSRDVVVDSGGLFRWPLQIDRVSGKIGIEINEGAIRLESPALFAANDDVETVTRLHADISSARQVYLDMQSDFINGNGKQAFRYIPASILSDAVVGWLDKAFVDGHVPSGSFIFHGNASDYPFDDNRGVMQVLFDVEGGSLHFLDGWPDVNNASATVEFHNASLSVTNARSYERSGASAVITAGIADLRNAMLTLNGSIKAPADELQHYIWNSGLDSVLGRTVEQFQASGQAEINLDISVPLGKARRETEKLQATGDITFRDNELFFPVSDHLITGIHGTLFFNTTSLQAENIRAEFYGSPVNIDIRTLQDKAAAETLFYISGTAKVADLLRKYQWDYPALLDGQSHWDVVLHVPHKAKDYNIMLEASSMLEGVKIGVSDIITKPADTSVPLSANFKMLGSAQRLTVVSQDRLNLEVTFDKNDSWQFNVDSPVVSGKGKISANFDAASTTKLDFKFLNLSAFMSGDGRTARRWKLKAADMPSLRIKAESLVWKDWKLKNVEIESDRHSRGMVVNRISIDDPHIKITGKGSWLRRSWRLDEETTFSFKLSSPNMGDMLQHLGYARYVDRSKMVATLHWRWPGAPYRFNWESLSGNSTIEFEKGILTDIDPGTGGRFLGLFNLLHLPKRLSLDFKDVYKDGFVFDAIKGTYVFGSGDAITQDTEISASAADLTMMGRIGMADQDYDLVAIVTPQSSVATFAGGALVAGPTIGVGLVLLQEIFGLDLLGQEIYTIEGGWDNPVVKQISSDAGAEQPEDVFDDF
jgi:uncharacterized protein YhdP